MTDETAGRGPGQQEGDGDHEHEHEHDHEQIDPRIVAGWRSLEEGDLENARTSAQAVLSGADVSAPGMSTHAGDDASAAAQASRMDALLLLAACAREADDVEGALRSLEQAAKEDPGWCTPELWMAELLSEDPERLDQALRHARRALDHAEEEDEYLEALRCKATIELELDRPTEARKTLGGLPPADVPLPDENLTLDVAQLLIDAGDPAEARVRLETLLASSPELADAWYLLGAAAELVADEEAKRDAWLKTRTLDLQAADGDVDPADDDAAGDGDHAAGGAGRRAGPRLSQEALVVVAEQTLAELPEVLRTRLKDVPIVVAEVPAREDVASGLDPRLLGLFSGTPLGENGGVLEPATLNEIVLFRRNIERFAVDEDSLRAEVRTTMLHEAGHFFGLDDDALARAGLD